MEGMESTEHLTGTEPDEPSSELAVSDDLIERALNSCTEKPLNLRRAYEKGLADAEVSVFNIGIVSISVVPLQLLQKKIKVTVRLCGFPVGEYILTEGEFEQTIGPNIGIAKASVTVAADWADSKLRYSCRACVRNWYGKWKCKTNEGVLADW